MNNQLEITFKRSRSEVSRDEHTSPREGKVIPKKKLCCIAEKILDIGVDEDYIIRELEALNEKFQNKKWFAYGCKAIKHPFEEYKHKHKIGVTKLQNSLLHLAVLQNRDEVAKTLIEMAPRLVKKERTSDEHEGQTPFHIAIAKEKFGLVQDMARALNADGIGDLLSVNAIGTGLLGTVMMGELPLSIAALTKKSREMVKFLLDYGADHKASNSKKETILHSIIMWGFYNPETSSDALEKLKTIKDVLEKEKFRSLIEVQNIQGLTPLQLTAKTCQYELFKELMIQPDVYKFQDKNWGLDDIYEADVTELDRLCWVKQLKAERKKESSLKRSAHNNTSNFDQDIEVCACIQRRIRIYGKQSGLEALFYGPLEKALQFMSHGVIDELIFRKWKAYRYIFYAFGFMHLLFMCMLTALGVFRTYIIKGLSEHDAELTFVTSATGLSLIFGIFYTTQEIIRTFVFWKPWFIGKFHHNFIYRFSLLFFGLSLIIDSIWNLSQIKTPQNQQNYSLYFVLGFGWFSCLFFLRGHTYTSFYSYMFITSIFGEIFFFLPVILPIVMTFPVALHEAFLPHSQYCTTVNDSSCPGSITPGFETYWHSLFTLFQWMNGLGETENVLDAPVNGLSGAAFVLFVILCNIVLLNMIIALLTNREDLKYTEKYPFAKLQKLSVIIFMEDFIVPQLQECCGKDNHQKGGKQVHRYYMDVKHVRSDDVGHPSLSVKTLLQMIAKETKASPGDTLG